MFHVLPHSLVAATGPPGRRPFNLLGSLPAGAGALASKQGDTGLQMLLGALDLYNRPGASGLLSTDDSQAIHSLLDLNQHPCAIATSCSLHYMPVSRDEVELPRELDDETCQDSATIFRSTSCKASQPCPDAVPAGGRWAPETGSAASGYTGAALPAASTASDAGTAAPLLLLLSAVNSIQNTATDPRCSQPGDGSHSSCDASEPASSGPGMVSAAQGYCTCSATARSHSSSDSEQGSRSRSGSPPAPSLEGLAAVAATGLLAIFPQYVLAHQPQQQVPDAADLSEPASSGGSRGKRGSRSRGGGRVCSSGGGVQKQQRQEPVARAARKCWESELTIDILEENGCFDMTQAHATRYLGFSSPTTLKKAMARLGIQQWPNRKRTTVRNMLEGLEKYLPQYGEPDKVEAVLAAVRRELSHFLRTHTGAIELPPDIVALRQVVYKLKNEEKDPEKKETLRQEVERLMQTLVERLAGRQEIAEQQQGALSR